MSRSPPCVARRAVLLAGLALAAPSPAPAQVVFPVVFDESTAVLSDAERGQLRGHLQEAGRRWIAQLTLGGPRSIEMLVKVSDAVPRATGRSLVSVYIGVSGGRATYEQGAAHELRTGADQNGLLPDLDVTINPGYLRQELWFDPDPAQRIAPVPKTRTDALSVLLHELGHAFAYNGWADGAGNVPAEFWSTFDRWMLGSAPVLFDGPAVLALQGIRPDLTAGNIHHWANELSPRRASGAAMAEPRWESGAPQPHAACHGVPSVPPAAAGMKGGLPAGLRHELMNGVAFYRGERYDISALDRAALLDAGLPLDTAPIFDSSFER